MSKWNSSLEGKAWQKQYSKKYRQTAYGKLMYWKHHVKSVYGLTVEQIDAQLLKQGNVCAICKQRGKFHIDHDHNRPKGPDAFRGMLCGNCNRALGCMHDDPGRLRAAAEYLERADA